jgi:hypothetical protein
MTGSNRKPLKKQTKEKKNKESKLRVPSFPDRALDVLRKSKHPLFKSPNLAWVIVNRKLGTGSV